MPSLTVGLLKEGSLDQRMQRDCAGDDDVERIDVVVHGDSGGMRSAHRVVGQAAAFRAEHDRGAGGSRGKLSDIDLQPRESWRSW